MELIIIAVIAILAFAAVLFPVFFRDTRADETREFDRGESDALVAPMAAGPGTPMAPDRTDAQADETPLDNVDAIEREVLRYRTALRGGTVCRKCGQANPERSAFCYECGARLPLADEKEFE